MVNFIAIGLLVLCYTLIMLSILIFYTTVIRYRNEEKTPRKWIMLSLIFVPIFVCSIGYAHRRETLPPIDWGAGETYIGLGLCVFLILLSCWILSNMYSFTLYALVRGIDPLEKKSWHRNGLFFTCYLDGVPPKEKEEKQAEKLHSNENVPARKFSYKDCAMHYPDMVETSEEIARCLADIEKAELGTIRRYNAVHELWVQIVNHGDPEYDSLPEHVLIPLHASKVGATLEAEDQYLLWALQMVESGLKSIYDFHDRMVNSILRRRLGIPSSVIKFKKELVKGNPYLAYAWEDRLNACKKIYTIKFYRADGRPQTGVPMEEYEYKDDINAAEAHFERFRNDRSLLYSHIELTEVGAGSAERVLRRINF